MKVLLIEDNTVTAELIIKGLKEAGIRTVHATDGIEGYRISLVDSFDAAIVDLILPGMDGLSLISNIRKAGVQTPIIILSVKDAIDDRVKGLQEGGDDYLVKPFAFPELLARLQALIRRCDFALPGNILEVGDLRMDLESHQVIRNRKKVKLQPKEFMVLEYFLRRQGRVVTKTAILEQIWDYHFDTHTNVVESRICKLREKIDRPFERKLLHTVHKIGYILEER